MAAKKPPVGIAPPQPVELEVSVRRDEKADIFLRIVGKTGEPLKYLIRVPPAHGHLTDPHPTEREVSMVTYQPPADLAITTDKFSYAVQNSIGVSGAVDVNITIVDDKPHLTFPDTLDFAKTRAGTTSYGYLEISNHGGLIATGEIFVDPPWRIDGKNAYKLKNGDVAVFKIAFEPTAGFDYEGVARYTSEPEHSTTLKGTGVAVIAANPTRWVLTQTPGDTTRAGTFELISNLDEERHLHFKTDSRLKIKPMDVVLPARGKVKVSVEATAEETQAFDTEIHLDAPPDFSIPVPVRVPTLAAIVRSTAPVVDFGRVRCGPDASTLFELENAGGTSTTIRWEVSQPFRVKEQSTLLKPGEKKAFSIELDTKIPNHYRSWLHVKAGTQAFDVPLEAQVVTSGKTGPSAQPSMFGVFKSKMFGKAASPYSPPASDAAREILLASIPPDLIPVRPPPPGVRVTSIKPTSAVIEWPASLSPASQYLVEVRLLGTNSDHKTLGIKWQPLQDAIAESRPPNYSATIRDLAPDQPWTVRVRPVPSPGNPGEPIFTINFATPRVNSFHPHFDVSTIAQLLLAALLLLVGWQVWQRTKYRSIV